jgi:hypothetical protein
MLLNLLAAFWHLGCLFLGTNASGSPFWEKPQLHGEASCTLVDSTERTPVEDTILDNIQLSQLFLLLSFGTGV